jgi:hypothetical protein
MWITKGNPANENKTLDLFVSVSTTENELKFQGLPLNK